MFLNLWKDTGLDGMVWDFKLKPSELDGVKVLLASYGYGNYCGVAFVLFKRDGKLFEVNANHCSCYGLEQEWYPEETTKEALLHRLNEGKLGDDGYTDNVFRDELREVLKNA